MGLPKRRGTIASAAQTPWTRRRAELGRGLVLGRGPERVPVKGRADRRAGPAVGLGYSACAARFFGRRDLAPFGTKLCPQKPPRGADHPNPTPPARDSAQPASSEPASGQQKLPLVADQRRQVEEVAPAVSASLGQPAAPGGFQLRQGAPPQLETTEFGHASQHKPSTLGCLPRNDGWTGWAPLRTACTFSAIQPRTAPAAPPKMLREEGCPTRLTTNLLREQTRGLGSLSPCPNPTH
ncbi:MAG: hypothetical protein QOF13_93 [Solirubrobacterales bacterium]|nr:hypothetical protein [Solirubrobacterales bacterium]